MHVRDVIVVGAGLAGLTAGYTLKKAGLDVLVLEARDRVGGRVKTYKSQNGVTAELGGEWIGKNHQHILNLCNELSLPLVNHSIQKVHYYLSGMTLEASDNQVLLSLEKLTRLLEDTREVDATSLDSVSWEVFLQQQGFSVTEINKIDDVFDSDFIVPPRLLSAGFVLFTLRMGGESDHIDFRIRGGNDLLPRRLAEIIGEECVLTNAPVSRIEKSQEEILVTTEQGVHNARYVVVTVPAPLLPSLIFNPPLARVKSEAVKQLGYGTATKILCVFKEKFWEEENWYVDGDGLVDWLYHSSFEQNGGEYILTSYVTGSEAERISKLNKTTIVFLLKEELKKIGYAMPDPESVTIQNWGEEEYSQGAFSTFLVGQWTSSRKALAQNEGNMYFAGEYTEALAGYMESAISSGVRVAEQILDRKAVSDSTSKEYHQYKTGL